MSLWLRQWEMSQLTGGIPTEGKQVVLKMIINMSQHTALDISYSPDRSRGQQTIYLSYCMC